MIVYIIPFFIILLIGLFINKKYEEQENKKEKKDYGLHFLIYSIIGILCIIYIKLLFSDIFINFLKEYTSIGFKLETLKLYFFPKTFNKPTLKNIEMLGGGKSNEYKIRDFINNELPMSDSDISSLF